MVCVCLLLDREDGERFSKCPRQGAIAFALTPEAAAAVIEAGLPVSEPSRRQLWWAAARATVVVQRVLAQLGKKVPVRHRLSAAGEYALDRTVRRAVVTGTRIWTVLGGIRQFVWFENGEWKESSDRFAAYSALMHRIGLRIPVYDFAPGDRRMDFAQTVLGYRIARRQKMRGALFYQTLLKHFTAIGAAVNVADPDTVQFGAVRGLEPSWEKIEQLKRGVPALPAHGCTTFTVGLDLGAYRRGARRCEARLECVKDEYLRLAIATERKAIVNEVACTEGYATWLQRLFFWQRPKVIFLNSMSVGLNVALAQAGRRWGVPVFLISHCSVGEGQAEDPLLAAGMGHFNFDLTASPFADIQVVQSPHAAAVAAKLAPDARRLRIEPAIWGLKRVARGNREGKNFRILHAGNFQPWSYYEPFWSECSLEYCAGIAEIARAVMQVPGCEFIIRMKPGHQNKAECLVKSIKAKLPAGFECRFSTTGSFYDELADADLVVSFTSTVIEEAVMNRIPVLLHSGTRIRPFFSAGMEPPTLTSRKAVYAAGNPDFLPAMIQAIARAHATEPLSLEEIAPHVWKPGEALDLAAFAKFISSKDLKKRLLL